MVLVDSHCHLDQLDLSVHHTLENTLAAARTQNIGHMLCVSTTLEGFPQILELATLYPDISCSVGIQPSETNCREATCDELIALTQNPQVIGIGETGLDYHYDYNTPQKQRERFRQHVLASQITRKPLIIHMREASFDLWPILKEAHIEEVGGVMHCFTGTWEEAQQAMDLNLYISFSGIITFPKAETIREIARKIPLERILIETDAPYLAPVPHRGKPNEPAYLYHTAEYLAALRGIPLDTLAHHTTQNFERLFKTQLVQK